MNLFDFKIPKDGEDFTTLFQNSSIEISRIVSSSKIEEKVYIQDKDEFVVVLEGKAKLEVDGRIVTLTKGEYLFIESKTPHKIISTDSGTLWLAIYFNP